MQPKTKNPSFVIGIIAIMLVCVPMASSRSIGIKLDVEHSVELTKVDLLSLPDWEQKRVAVDGFVLGMTRKEALEVARLNNLKLRSDLPPKNVQELKVPCRETSCSVSQINGNWIGINLFFNADLLAKIRVSVPVDSYPEVKEVNISHKFKGRTYQFFNNYSEDLRNQIFGSVERKENPVRAATLLSTLTEVEYRYLHSGVIIHVTIDKRDHPPKPFDLEVDFVTQE